MGGGERRQKSVWRSRWSSEWIWSGGLAHPPPPTPLPSGWEGWPRSPMVIVEQTDQDLVMQLAKTVKARLSGRSLGLTLHTCFTLPGGA